MSKFCSETTCDAECTTTTTALDIYYTAREGARIKSIIAFSFLFFSYVSLRQKDGWQPNAKSLSGEEFPDAENEKQKEKASSPLVQSVFFFFAACLSVWCRAVEIKKKTKTFGCRVYWSLFFFSLSPVLYIQNERVAGWQTTRIEKLKWRPRAKRRTAVPTLLISGIDDSSLPSCLLAWLYRLLGTFFFHFLFLI